MRDRLLRSASAPVRERKSAPSAVQGTPEVEGGLFTFVSKSIAREKERECRNECMNGGIEYKRPLRATGQETSSGL